MAGSDALNSTAGVWVGTQQVRRPAHLAHHYPQSYYRTTRARCIGSIALQARKQRMTTRRTAKGRDSTRSYVLTSMNPENICTRDNQHEVDNQHEMDSQHEVERACRTLGTHDQMNPRSNEPQHCMGCIEHGACSSGDTLSRNHDIDRNMRNLLQAIPTAD